jgi:hypothetical protein
VWTERSLAQTAQRLKTIRASHRLSVFPFVSLFLVRSFVRSCAYMREGDFIRVCVALERLYNWTHATF